MNLVSPDINPQEIDFLSGALLLVNKPKDWTSFDVVNKIRYTLKSFHQVKKIKVGHAGTLDPMATGLLIVCTGKMTKSIQQFQDLDKVYEGTMVLGASTASYDAETEIVETFATDSLETEQLIEKSKDFIGAIDQVPPMYSAIKIKGQALYKLARLGKTVERNARRVSIKSFELSMADFPQVDFSVHCSKGTYIRSLVHDFGKSLDNAAYLSRLVRTHIGDFKLNDAWELADFIAKINDREKSI
jgi:tRNA pseudouridine55 synthase